MPRRFFRCLVLALVLTCSALAQVVYVDVSATGSQTGASWTDAYTDLQAALAVTTQGEIWVAQGDYYPGAAGNRSATFQLINGVTLYGGFAGTETSVSQRDVETNVTILNGDIDQNDTYGPSANWWQFQWTGSLGNSYHVVTGTGTDATAILDGFTIRAGRGDDPVHSGGAGLLVDGGSPGIKNCTFQYNAVGHGSAAKLIDCNSVFESCVIRDGYTCNCGSGGYTSGVLCLGTSDVTFTDCDFINHYYVSSLNQGRGAALSIDFNCNGTLTGCRFIGNQTGNFYPIGGGIAYGGGVNCLGSIVADRCEFIDNFAHAGAGMTVWGPATITNCLFAKNQAVSHPNTSGFDDGGYGGGLLTVASGQVSVTNCTFVDNDSDKGAGLALYGVGPATIRSCIIYHNFGPAPLPNEDPVWILKRQIVGNFDIANSCVEGLLQTEPGEDPPSASGFPGCFDMPPDLISLATEDYRLQPTSPCIDTGDGTALPPALTLDLDGNSRVVGTIDIGCYEFAGTPLPSLVSTNLVEGSPASCTVHNALPGETVYLGVSLIGTIGGPCLPPPSNLCIELAPPFAVLAVLTADPGGHAPLNFALPVSFPLIDTWVQAVMLRGIGGADSVATKVVFQSINAMP